MHIFVVHLIVDHDLCEKKKLGSWTNMCVRFLSVYLSYSSHHACVMAMLACVRAYVRTLGCALPTYLHTCIASPTEHRECGDYATRVARCNRPTVLYQRSLACRFYLTRFDTPLDLNFGSSDLFKSQIFRHKSA